MNKVILLFASIILMTSCNEPIGKWNDIIKLSAKNIEFEAKADSVIITTEGDWWWITKISLADSIYNESINTAADFYIITENSFVIERRDKNTLSIKLNENTTGKKRTMVIGLEAGDYFDSITINQSEK